MPLKFKKKPVQILLVIIINLVCINSSLIKAVEPMIRNIILNKAGNCLLIFLNVDFSLKREQYFVTIRINKITNNKNRSANSREKSMGKAIVQERKFVKCTTIVAFTSSDNISTHVSMNLLPLAIPQKTHLYQNSFLFVLTNYSGFFVNVKLHYSAKLPYSDIVRFANHCIINLEGKSLVPSISTFAYSGDLKNLEENDNCQSNRINFRKRKIIWVLPWHHDGNVRKHL